MAYIHDAREVVNWDSLLAGLRWAASESLGKELITMLQSDAQVCNTMMKIETVVTGKFARNVDIIMKE